MKTFLPSSTLPFLLCFLFCFANAGAQCTLSSTTNASALTCGVSPLAACNGVLNLGNGTAMTLTMDAALDLTCLGPIQLIIQNNATLYFTAGNDHLTLAEGSSIVLKPGSVLSGGSCNASERIYIGNNLLASCNGGSGADVSFPDLATLGGTGSAASNSPVCVGNTINLSATPPPNGTYTYSWSGPGLAATTYSSSPNYNVTATVSGTYQVKMKSPLITNPAIAEITVTVISLTTPGVGTITQPNCTTTTGSVVINSLPASGAWTLTRTGTSGATTTGTGTSTTISGLALGTYNFQVSNGSCNSAVSANVVITPSSASIWNGNSWSNGTPTATTNVVFNGNYSNSANVRGCSCQVTSGDVVIKSGYWLKIDKQVKVLGGSLTIEDNASLVQVDNNVVNTGSISVKRSAMVKKFDYVYWSAPVANFPLTSVSPTTSTAHLWKWLPTIGGNNGNWANANETMQKGKGYIVRGPSTFDNTATQKFSTVFTGTPNNGTLTATIERGGYQNEPYTAANGSQVTNRDDNFNLIGNPYPSAIKVLDFLNANSNLEGAVRIWTHGTLPTSGVQNPFYGSFTYNYTMNDYIVYNGTGTISGPFGFNGYIASGQGFFVCMNDGAATTSTVTFNNSMRSENYSNSQFFRVTPVVEDLRQDGRLWLDLLPTGGSPSRILVGYVAGATAGQDRLYDAALKAGTGGNFYSLIDGQKMSIQGRALPFATNDVVALGFQCSAANTFNVAIAAVDGLFQGHAKPIYLKDQLLNIIHDLRESPYEFTSAAGTFDNRFVLLYQADQGNKGVVSGTEEMQGAVAVTQQDGQISVASAGSGISAVKVYDLTGRMLFEREQVNGNRLELTGLAVRRQVLVLQIRLGDGNTITKKVNY